MSERRKNRTIFRVILLPLLLVLVIELLLLVSVYRFGGVFSKLDQNAQDMLWQQVDNRGNYLSNEMLKSWSNLDFLSEKIQIEVEMRLENGTLRLDDWEKNREGCLDLLKQLMPSLVETMYNKQVTGIYLILNTQDLKGGNVGENLPGIYLRDLDPASTPSERYQDILIERAPTDVVRDNYIATDTGWKPTFSKEDSVEKSFFYKPFQTAYEDKSQLEAKEYGYWTTEPYTLSGDNRSAISYSIPLILEDGTVYGVLGVEILTDYITSLLPCGELMENKQGSYLLATAKEGEKEIIPLVISGETMSVSDIEAEQFKIPAEGQNESVGQSDKYYAVAKQLKLYSKNAPFDSEQWYLMGISARKALFAFSRQIDTILIVALFVTFVIGFLGILLISYRLSKPIRRLSEQVEEAQKQKTLPQFQHSGIREIDQFADEISHLSQEVVASSTRFLRIMDMASVELAGYEIQNNTDFVYVTDNFFPLLGVEDISVQGMTVADFEVAREKVRNELVHTNAPDGSEIYTVVLAQGGTRYLRWEDKNYDGRCIGLIEDVTVSTLEKMRIERERDCDGLTKLYGRSGFRREADRIFKQPEQLKCAALLMLDLDNLKTTNDTYGHTFGDLYIQTAGQCFYDNVPSDSLCARISGDEFVILFYGYDTQEEIREIIQKLHQAINEVEFVLPDGKNMGLSASGGVAWYGQDSLDFSELMKFADFAMYQVKKSKKGFIKEFEAEAYQQKLFMNQCRKEFQQMVEQRLVNYYFQPIFSGKTGKPFAYEALMRVNLPNLRSPATVLNIAKESDRMHEMEAITFFRASECYMELLGKEMVNDQAYLFINSIANVCMTLEEEAEFHERFSSLQSNIVIEITEEESMDMNLTERKRNAKGFSGMLALDDYGSGYNTEINLLELHPKFVKVDITIVRDIDTDLNKQQIVSNLVDYAHKRDMLVIAEGLETANELRKCLELGVDLFQGYYLARPQEVPPAISHDAYMVISEFQGHPN